MTVGRSLLLVVLLSGCSPSQNASLPITERPGWFIHGAVIDVDSNVPANDADVTLLRSQQRFPWTDPQLIVIARTSTDATGKFEFSSQLTGNFYINTTKSGYCSVGPVGYSFAITTTVVKRVTAKITRRNCRMVY